jgi:hypothetical protein
MEGPEVSVSRSSTHEGSPSRIRSTHRATRLESAEVDNEPAQRLFPNSGILQLELTRALIGLGLVEEAAKTHNILTSNVAAGRVTDLPDGYPSLDELTVSVQTRGATPPTRTPFVGRAKEIKNSSKLSLTRPQAWGTSLCLAALQELVRQHCVMPSSCARHPAGRG